MAKKQAELPEYEGLMSVIERWWARTPVRCKFLLVGIGICKLLGFLIYAWFCIDEEFAQFTSYLIAGSLVLLQIAIANRRATAAGNTAKAMQHTAEITEKNNIAELFNDTVKYLGNTSVSVRLGGVYSLHQIAIDNERYRKLVFEILCAHIRGTTTQEGYKPIIDKEKKIRPSDEIQDVLDLLFVKSGYHEIYSKLTDNGIVRANLEGAKLQGAMLIRAKLKNAILNHVNLKYAVLLETDLSQTNLYRANLQKSLLIGANLSRARLSWTKLQHASLSEVNLQEAKLLAADLTNSDGLKIKQLLQTRTLHATKFSDKMRKEINSRKPELFDFLDDRIQELLKQDSYLSPH